MRDFRGNPNPEKVVDIVFIQSITCDPESNMLISFLICIGLAYELNEESFTVKCNTMLCETNDEDELEDKEEEEEEATPRYPQFIAYLKDVLKLKYSWALCYRTELMLRGHNTNNNAEAQFLVIKDKILQRVKEYNIVSLMEKLIVEFKDHYKDKLLSVASGSYDSFTARRFDGKSKKKGELGYKVRLMERSAFQLLCCLS